MLLTDLSKLQEIVVRIANGEELEPKYRNHKLFDNKKYKDCKECHLEPDWLLVYRIKEKELLLLLVGTGSHSDIF